MSISRTPKKLLMQSKRSKRADLTNSKRNAGLAGSSSLHRKARKRDKKKLKASENTALMEPSEDTNYKYFAKDFTKAKAFRTTDLLQSKCWCDCRLEMAQK